MSHHHGVVVLSSLNFERNCGCSEPPQHTPSMTFPCGNIWIPIVVQMSHMPLNKCDWDKLGRWTGVTHSQDGNDPVCVRSNLKCLECKCTYLGLEKYRYFFRWWSFFSHLAIRRLSYPLLWGSKFGFVHWSHAIIGCSWPKCFSHVPLLNALWKLICIDWQAALYIMMIQIMRDLLILLLAIQKPCGHELLSEETVTVCR